MYDTSVHRQELGPLHFLERTGVESGPLPKASTGKVQKYVLREKEWRGQSKRIN